MAKATAKSTKAKKKTSPEAASTPEVVSDKPRRLQAPKYKSFQLHKRIKPTHGLPGAFNLLRQAFKTFGRHWKVFFGITLIYGLLNVILVQGFNAAGDLSEIKSTLDEIFTGNLGMLASGGSPCENVLSAR